MVTKVKARMCDADVATQAELDAVAAAGTAAIAQEMIDRDAAIAATNPSQRLTLAAAQATTSGTSKDFTGIPSWVKRITICLNGVSLSGTAGLLVQVGTSGGVVTSGYASTSCGLAAGGNFILTATNGLVVYANLAAQISSGNLVLTHLGGNVWVSSHGTKIATTNTACGGGDVSLGGVLDRVRITTTNGTDTFDAGSVSILYE